eukprot:gb/GEZN01006727.1/.p1 GENE.gb/GEZN01006727.1/~~gb/GEZN01006727.1/.p1  ORF type:complete len:313 (-),score=85.34 gb/GEZN01006727.1/:641-1579(-)
MATPEEKGEDYEKFLEQIKKLKIDQEKEAKKEAEEKAKAAKKKKKGEEEEHDPFDDPQPNIQDVQIGSEIEQLLTESLAATVARQEKSVLEDKEYQHCALLTLRIRNYDMKSAAERLKNYMHFRITNKVSEWNPQKSPMCKKIMQVSLINVLPDLDKSGRMMIWARKRYDQPESWSPMDLIKTMHYVYLAEYAKRDPKVQMLGLTIMLDMAKATHKNMDMNLPKIFFKEVGKSFPFRFSNMLIVRPSGLVSVVLPVIKAFAPAKLAARINVVEDKTKLADFAELSHLPEELGGTLKYDRAAWLKTYGVALDV